MFLERGVKDAIQPGQICVVHDALPSIDSGPVEFL
jgi:hypothetical protein